VWSADPIVTNVAFEAFSCFRFHDGRGWLVADVTIQCNTAEHAEATALATLAIACYPIGIFALNSALLFAARHAILSERPNRLSSAIAFLHREYKSEYYCMSPRLKRWSMPSSLKDASFVSRSPQGGS
jgi:hypothetical protein